MRMSGHATLRGNQSMSIVHSPTMSQQAVACWVPHNITFKKIDLKASYDENASDGKTH